MKPDRQPFTDAERHGRKNKELRTALITGAASGLGACFAERLGRDGYALVLVDRNVQLLEDQARRLRLQFQLPVHVIVEDLSRPGAAALVHQKCNSLGISVDFLVNNAGYHLNKLLHEMPWASIEDNVQVLLNVVVELTHHLLPGMIDRKWGRIINVCSVSGFMPGGVRLTTYNATKTFLIPFSEALNFELQGMGVQVTAVCPGFMRTSLFVNSGLTDVRDSVPRIMWLEPAQVADNGVHAVMQNRAVLIPGFINRTIITVAKFLPRKLLRERTRIFHRSARVGITAASLPDRTEATDSRVALVTGATAGIGASFAAILAAQGFNLVLVARREALLQKKAGELSSRYGIKVHTIVQDMTDPQATDHIMADLKTIGGSVDVLINNAGFPLNSLFHETPLSEVSAALQLYAVSVLKLTHELLPGMRSRGWGRIINVASLAGFEPGSYRSSLYSGLKAFQIAISESISAEQEGSGVSVTAVCPGFTKTEWMSHGKVDTCSLPSSLWMESDEVARIGWEVTLRGSPVVVTATPVMRGISTLFRLLPRRWVGAILSRKRRKMSD